MTDQKIETTGDGPFLAHVVTVRTADYVKADDGAPTTWSFGDAFEVDGDAAILCRCGQSSNKPFCDRSHVDAEWDPRDAEQSGESYEQRARRKQSPTEGYAMLDDTNVVHTRRPVRDGETDGVADDAGERVETRNRVTLCRCGALGNKPFCDGSHKNIAFEGIE